MRLYVGEAGTSCCECLNVGIWCHLRYSVVFPSAKKEVKLVQIGGMPPVDLCHACQACADVSCV